MQKSSLPPRPSPQLVFNSQDILLPAISRMNSHCLSRCLFSPHETREGYSKNTLLYPIIIITIIIIIIAILLCPVDRLMIQQYTPNPHLHTHQLKLSQCANPVLISCCHNHQLVSTLFQCYLISLYLSLSL